MYSFFTRKIKPKIVTSLEAIINSNLFTLESIEYPKGRWIVYISTENLLIEILHDRGELYCKLSNKILPDKKYSLDEVRTIGKLKQMERTSYPDLDPYKDLKVLSYYLVENLSIIEKLFEMNGKSMTVIEEKVRRYVS